MNGLRKRRQVLFTIVSVLVIACGVRADIDTDPYLFSAQAIDSTGRFEWDEFEGTYGGPHATDVAQDGIGSAAFVATGVLNPGDGPPFGVRASTQNLYSGGTFGTWTMTLSDLDTENGFTSVVLQVATLGVLDPATILLDELEPTELIDRGVRSDVLHDIDGNSSAFDTTYYWAWWQLEPKSEYELSVTGAHTHLSFAAARIDYFNTAEPFDAVRPESVFIPLVDPDFDRSGSLGVADIDLLCQVISTGADPPNLDYDLSNDEQLTTVDVGLFLELAGSLAGDADLNGTVEFADFVVLAEHFGADGSWSAGDFDCSAYVEFPDFVVLAAEFGNSGSEVAASVPEPNATLLSIALFVIPVLGSRRGPYAGGFAS